MSNNYSRWESVTNPSVGFLTNNFVNYFEGVNITQTSPSGLHTLPMSFAGKKFHINNQGISTQNALVQVITQNGLETFTVTPGNGAIFVYIGNGIWDQTGGEDVINSLNTGTSVADSQQDQIISTITFTDTPATSPGTYVIGTIPAGFSVSNVSVNVTSSFNDSVVDSLSIVTSGGVVVMASNENDIKMTGNYTVAHPSANQTANGVINAVFNSSPNGTGGTQGSLTIIVEFLSI